ncbi:MAG TPA: trigger factor [Beutenbergiaceae bacterium]|nr:trigger factor [Beutenbergiaceae bacterium]
MKSAVENLDPTKVKLSVEVPMDDLKVHLDAAYAEVAQQVNIPGFRRGKAPARIIDQRVGKPVVIERAINAAMPDLYTQAVTEADIKPLGQPEIEITALPGLVEDEKELKFTAVIDIRPEVTIPDLSTLTVTVDDLEVGDDDVDAALEDLRAGFGTLVSVDRAAQEGDVLTIDMSATLDEEEIDSVTGITYEIGSGTLLEGMDEALTGLTEGETATFNSPLAGGEHEGKEAQITVTATAIKERELPELDDEFAQMASDDVDTLEELRGELREQVEQRKASDQAVQARDVLLEQLQEQVEFPTPEGVVEDEVHRHLEAEGRLDDDEHREEVREETTRVLRRQLLLDAVAEIVDPQVSQDELVQYLLQISQQSGLDPNEFISQADASGQIPMYVAEISRNKSLALALRQVKVVDASGNDVDLSEYIGSDEEDQAAAEASERFIDVTDDAAEVAEAVDVVEVVEEEN